MTAHVDILHPDGLDPLNRLVVFAFGFHEQVRRLAEFRFQQSRQRRAGRIVADGVDDRHGDRLRP
ncbi:MAG TPA: hypothetical protein DEB39_03130, partial [Planctomycetaceae bacterium]|nr:hypothetical protein [Planctomycetaceae bacterium]